MGVEKQWLVYPLSMIMRGSKWWQLLVVPQFGAIDNNDLRKKLRGTQK